MGHYDKFIDNDGRVDHWTGTANKTSQEIEIDKLKQDVLQLKYEVASLKREIAMLPEGSGRYDNLHGDEDEVLYTREDLERWRDEAVDFLNDQEWIENNENI